MQPSRLSQFHLAKFYFPAATGYRFAKGCCKCNTQVIILPFGVHKNIHTIVGFCCHAECDMQHSCMPRRRRKSNGERAIEAFVPLVALFIFAWYFSPQFRSLVVTVAAIVGGVLVIGLIMWLVLRKRRAAKQAEVVAEPVSLPTVAAPRSRALILAEIKSARQSSPRFTAELLSSLEWRRFEILVMLYFQKTGHEAKRSRAGADGGVDIFLSQPGQSKPQACVQCKAWNVYDVGVKPVRELLGVMAADSIPLGYFVTTGVFTNEATMFAHGKPLVLMDGRHFLDALNALPEGDRAAILQEVTAGDYTTPTCPRCDVKMVQRESDKGPFWGCRSYPRCRQTFKMAEKDAGDRRYMPAE